MGMMLATETLNLINAKLEADQGGSFREWLGRVIPHMDDAYRGEEDGFRSHMGASLIGAECARAIWYGFHWTIKPKFQGRLLRLFNRGHLEEARFIALLLMIGCEVYQQDANGKQFRISDAGGHLGGSGDGVVIGLPELPQGQPAVIECKTHSDKSFKALQVNGVKEAKFQHYVQMNLYMYKMGIPVALYMAVNKNDDDLYLEIVYLDIKVAEAYLNRGIELVFMPTPPKKLNSSPGFYKCKWCDQRPVCHLKAAPAINCRTCKYSAAAPDGTWTCGNTQDRLTATVIPKEVQLTGCPLYEVSGVFEL